MQKSYVVLKRVNLTSAAFYIDTGDILVFDAANNNNLTVYRNGKLMKTTTHSEIGIAAMVKASMIELVKSPTDTTPIADPDPLKLSLGGKIEEAAIVADLEVESSLDTAIDAAATEADKAGAKVLEAVHAIEAEADKIFSDATPEAGQVADDVKSATDSVANDVKSDAGALTTDVKADADKVTTEVEYIVPATEVAATAAATSAETAVAAAVVDPAEAAVVDAKTTAETAVDKVEGATADAKSAVDGAVTDAKAAVTDVVDEGKQIETTATDVEKIATDVSSDVEKVGSDAAGVVDPKKVKAATKAKSSK
jgi:hypothetical protein